MRKVLSGLFSSIVIVVVPLVAKIQLVLNYKILIIILIIFGFWLTQPVFTVQETQQQKNVDRFSVLLILIMSFLTTIIPIIDWAYFKTDHTRFSIWVIVSILIAAAGLAFRYWAIKTLGKFFTPTVQIQQGHQLITRGPYRIVRHPSYTGAFLSIIAGSIVLESMVGFVLTIIGLGIAYYKRISIEEAELKDYFGESYSQYCKTTKKVIPFLL